MLQSYRNRRAIFAVLTTVATLAVLYGALPRLSGARSLWTQASSGDLRWIAVAAALEVLSFAGYAALFCVVLGGDRIDRSAAWLITLAGVAATRLFAAGGAGGVALTAWALQRAGRDTRQTAAGLASFLLLLYAVYMIAMTAACVGLLTGVLPGDAPRALTGAGTAIGAGALLFVPLLGLFPRHAAREDASRLRTRIDAVLDAVPGGVRRARAVLATGDRGLWGAVAWWAFDIAALGASLHAFGAVPSVAPLVVAYFMGMLGNLLPVPGGVGGVEGGMIGALIACHVDSSTAISGVLAYRVVSLWLPAAVGVVAYGGLVRRTRHWNAESPPSAPGASA